MLWQPNVVMCSMWRDDATRRLTQRAAHLLSKAEDYPNLRWVWVVGDSRDDTVHRLADLTVGRDVTIVEMETGILGEDTPARLRRLSQTANVYLDYLTAEDDYILIHESDIISPADVVNRLVAHADAGRCPVAGWPVLDIRRGRRVFYDTWAYRQGGRQFTNAAPYHPAYVPDAPFVVDSAGTMLLFAAADAPHVRMEAGGFLDICAGLRAQGRSIWVDPQLIIEQPHALWVMRSPT